MEPDCSIETGEQCELCGTTENLRRCHCSVCLEESPRGRVLCADCANGYDKY